MERPPFEWSKRRALRAVGCTSIAAVSGCLTQFSQADPCTGRTRISLIEATDAHVSNEFSTPVDGLAFATRTVVEDTLDTGEATIRGYYSPRMRAEYVVTGLGTRYYRVTTTEHDRTETTGYEYAVEIGVDESALSDDDRIHPFTELPAPDRESIHRALGNTVLLHAPHYTSFSVVFAYEHDETRRQSAFVPNTDIQYVEWEDTLLRLEFDGKRPVQIASTTVTAEIVAEQPGEFVEHLGGERGVVLDDLTSQQREIVTRAFEEDYTECRPYSASFLDLLDRLSTSEGGYTLLVQYGSVWYFAKISQ